MAPHARKIGSLLPTGERMPAHRFLAALAASLLLHGLALAAATTLLRQPLPQTPAMLTATLLRPAEVTADDNPLLKNTLTEGSAERTPPPLAAAARGPAQSAQRKLAEHLYYPEEAVAQGWEGEVRLLLRLDADGNVLDAQVASGSGHAILDQAAVRAAYAVGRMAGAGHELLLPVVFRLQR